MSLLDGLFSAARAAVPGAVAARSGFLRGQDEREKTDRAEKRQSLLDKMTADLHAAQIREADARAAAAGTASEQFEHDVDGNPYRFNRKTGRLERVPVDTADGSGSTGGASSASAGAKPSGSLLDRFDPNALSIGGAAPPQPAHPNGMSNETSSTTPLTDAMKPSAAPASTSGPRFGSRLPAPPAARRVGSEVDPIAKMYDDVYSDGTRKPVRAATEAELTKATQKPRDPNAPPPKDPASERRMQLTDRLNHLGKQIDQTQKDIDNEQMADDYDKPSGVDRKNLLVARRDSLRKVSDDVNAQLGDVVTRTLPADLQAKAAKPPAGSSTPLLDGMADIRRVAPVVAAPAAKPSSSDTPGWMTGIKIDPKSGAPEGIDLSAVAQASEIDKEKANVAIERIQKGQATVADAFAFSSLNPRVKALLWKRLKDSLDTAAPTKGH